MRFFLRLGLPAGLLLALTLPARADGVLPPKTHTNVSLGGSASWNHGFGPRSFSHDALGGTLDVRFASRWGLEAAAAFYGAFNGSEYPGTWPLHETSWWAGLDVTFFIVDGHSTSTPVDLYILWGAGAVSTRPVSVVDPAHRAFAFQPKVAFDFGVGARFHLASRVALGLEIRDHVYNERLENPAVAPGEGRSDRGTWYGEARLTNAIETQIGMRVLLAGAP